MVQNSVKLSGIVLETFCFPRTASAILNTFFIPEGLFSLFLCLYFHIFIKIKISDLTLQLHLLQLILATKFGLSLLLGDSRYIGKKPVKNCLNARAKMTSDKFDDERLLARKTNENKMKNG